MNFSLRVVLTLRGLMCDGSSSRASGASHQQPCSRPAAIHGLALAAQWINEALDDEQCPCRIRLDWSRLTSVSALLRSSLCKAVALSALQDIRHVSATILEGFLHTMPKTFAGAKDELLRIEWFCGPEISWSCMLPGLLIDTPARLATDGRRQNLADLRLVLFDVSLEQWLPGNDSSSEFQPIGMERYGVETLVSAPQGFEVSSVRHWELSQFRKLADSLLEANVKVLACQKLVDPWLADHLHHNGVSVLSRLSIRHIDFVRRLSGAMPVTSLAALPHCIAGRLDRCSGRSFRRAT